jgi:site-specific recombinase XerD
MATWSNPEELVFTTDVGSAFGFRSLWHAFHAATTRAGVRRIRFRDLRHATATLVLTGGGELAAISKVLSYSDYGTTLNL